ncbi:hypothetical protein BER93_14760 [Xanthomonas fragariae]|nr:hypothetical protein BER92_14725 [Xanthomonas fragariae]AOD19144.1 hypothetical protein BER93_14760 [Xanthomonas fragariae]ENZ95275.1 hypothetical protein O1K_09222 [Xanthomonas fragariae LMG 25863]
MLAAKQHASTDGPSGARRDRARAAAPSAQTRRRQRGIALVGQSYLQRGELQPLFVPDASDTT